MTSLEQKQFSVHALLRHSPENNESPELLQELADPLVACWHWGDTGTRQQVLRIEAGHGAGIADDLHPVGIEVDLGRFRIVRLVAAMVDRDLA